jgi:Spy/CpxP family protein refolding chaperone
MHKHVAYILLMLGLALAPLPLAGQQPSPQPQKEQSSGRARFFGPVDPGPVQFLLRNRAELRLTAEQVSKLQEIDRQMEEKNQPYVAQLVQMRRQLSPPPRGREPTPEQRQAFEAQMRAAEPLLKKIRENNFASMRQVGDVLSEEQKAKIPVLLANERKDDGGRGQRRRGDDDRD